MGILPENKGWGPTIFLYVTTRILVECTHDNIYSTKCTKSVFPIWKFPGCVLIYNDNVHRIGSVFECQGTFCMSTGQIRRPKIG